MLEASEALFVLYVEAPGDWDFFALFAAWSAFVTAGLALTSAALDDAPPHLQPYSFVTTGTEQQPVEVRFGCLLLQCAV